MLTGRHWETKKPISPDGFLPESFSLMLPYHKKIAPQKHGFRWMTYDITPLSAAQGAGECVAPWFVHPKHRENVDVGILPLKDLPQQLLDQEKAAGHAEASSDVNAFDWAGPRLTTSIGDDVFVVGFPENIRTAGELPIWKRGSVASEPDLPINDLPYVLIDTGTRSGMSGSPVVRRQAAGVVPFGPNLDLSVFSSPVAELFGVYSSRFGADDLTSQLGIVWTHQVVSEILDNPKFGKSSLCTWLW